jgi:hypothetical protein
MSTPHFVDGKRTAVTVGMPVRQGRYLFTAILIDPYAIILTPELYIRAALDTDMVQRYAACKRQAQADGQPDPFPPPQCVRYPDGAIVCADGWHRIRADRQNRTPTIVALVTDGRDGAATSGDLDVVIVAGDAHDQNPNGWGTRDGQDLIYYLLTSLDGTRLNDQAHTAHVSVDGTTVARWRKRLYPADVTTLISRAASPAPVHMPVPIPASSDNADPSFDFGDDVPVHPTSPLVPRGADGGMTTPNRHNRGITHRVTAPARDGATRSPRRLAAVTISWTFDDGASGFVSIADLASAPAIAVDTLRLALRRFGKASKG